MAVMDGQDGVPGQGLTEEIRTHNRAFAIRRLDRSAGPCADDLRKFNKQSQAFCLCRMEEFVINARCLPGVAVRQNKQAISRDTCLNGIRRRLEPFADNVAGCQRLIEIVVFVTDKPQGEHAMFLQPCGARTTRNNSF
ncbi:MAG: hypothetical protein KKE37_00970 [Verrucomicrobia bacterium]|nr:hypothetical protein [Verrucomicrobiota bacterium]MBU4292018.1 hypothetical protein [Verrucomicrobiota bacterium]MBU4427906.1 hypothetical protein [Verrucomicrobiota bacterium]MCG2678852.1 hypothetical protein [Kiritimatiellia bacterium]